MAKTYFFSGKKNQDDLEGLETLRKLMDDEDGDCTKTDNFDYWLTEGSDFLKKKSYVINQLRNIRSIRESSDTPLKKLTDLIASTAYDYTSGSAETQVVFAKLGKKFRGNSAATAIVDAILIFAEMEVKMGVTRTVRQWYDSITSIADKMQHVSDEKSQLKTENLSLKNKVLDLEDQLNAAKALEKKRIDEIDKLHKHLGHLQKQYDSNSAIIATANRYLDDKPLSPEVLLRRFPNDEAYKKKEKDLEDKIKNLQDELGNESVPLSVLAEGLKDYVAEAGISKAQELFERLCYILLNVPAWTKNVPELKKFFKKARKEMEGRNVTMTGEHATYNENNNK